MEPAGSPRQDEKVDPDVSTSDRDALPGNFEKVVRTEVENRRQRLAELDNQRLRIFAQINEHIENQKELQMDIAQALGEFKEFYQGYTDYFWRLTPDEINGYSESYERVLTRVLDNLRQMWMRLSIAINQRHNPVYKTQLEKADKIAISILGSTKDIVKGKPILYFDKLFQISRHPYQTYPLIAISPERFDADGDSSLAHELGHHIFWNNGDLEQYAKRLDQIHEAVAMITLRKQLPKIDFTNPFATRRYMQSQFEQYATWIGWIEEAFADAFGAIMIGPKFAKSGQDMLIRERLGTEHDLIMHDGEHPSAAIRPFIAIEALRVVANQQQDRFQEELHLLIVELENRWAILWEGALDEEHKLALPLSETDVHAGHYSNEHSPSVTLQELRKHVAPLVTYILSDIDFAIDKQGTQSILSSTNYWGKEDRNSKVQDILALKEKILRDPLQLPKDRGAQSMPTLSTGPSSEGSSFQRFRTFVEKQREKALTRRSPKQISEGKQQPLWIDILAFNLALDHGVIHENCQCHTGQGCHKHGPDGGRLACS